METSTTLGRRLTTIRSEVRGNRHARAARRTLQHELSSYTTASELNDLEAILDRYSDEETAEIRRLLIARRVA
ncbi:MAG TPA: hypothetical protein VG268_05445 [Streptosporangiaceae bacterium]|jgi:hypothetical protein|nr:hypothetical protein [Streptosporangiaceae bacterium]